MKDMTYHAADRQASGNAVLLVVIDSNGAYWERSIVDETVLQALMHYGFAYRIHDLAHKRLRQADLQNCAGVLLAQNGLGNALTKKECELIGQAVHAGVGLVNMDYDIRAYPTQYLDLFGFSRINPHPIASDEFRIKDHTHYMTKLQREGEFHFFKKPVTAVAVESWNKDVVPLAEVMLGKEQLIYIRHFAPWSAFEPKNYPVVFALQKKEGRAVQFTINPRMWTRECYGHANGLDDLMIRSILWTVKKPFAANMVPPFVTMDIDDCEGRTDFAYVDAAVALGYRPMPSLFIHNVPTRLYAKIEEDLKKGRADYNTHAFDYFHLAAFTHGQGACTQKELDEKFMQEDAFWENVNAKPCPVNKYHFGEVGVNALPYLKKRGRMMFNLGQQQFGLCKADMSQTKGFPPFGARNCHYYPLPDDPSFYCFGAQVRDFLTTTTANLRESEQNDIDAAADRAAEDIRHGLRSAYFSDVTTHEQKFEVLSVEEWTSILKKADLQTAEYEKIYAGHEHIGKYIQGKSGVFIQKAHVTDQNLSYELAGKSDVSLQISVFLNEDDTVVRRYEERQVI